MAPRSLISLNDHLLCAMDTETTGKLPHHHEIIQLAVVPLDVNLDPYGDPFFSYMNPVYPERQERRAKDTHGISLEDLSGHPDPFTVSESLYEWFQNLSLPPKKRIIPLVHNSDFDIPFMKYWLGDEQYDLMFHYPTRDTQSIIAGMNDKAAFHNRPLPFKYNSLRCACEVLGIPLTGAHNALADAVACGAVYKALNTMGVW